MKLLKHTISLLLVLTLLLSSVSVGAWSLIKGEKLIIEDIEIPRNLNECIQNGTMVVEAEDIATGNNTKMIEDPDASGGKAMQSVSSQWYPELLTKDDYYTKIYVENPGDAGKYNVWIRSKAVDVNAADGPSFYVDNNVGNYSTKQYLGKNKKYTWRALGAGIELKEGSNYFAMRTQYVAIVDKIIITNNIVFTPEGKDDVPVYMTPEEQEIVWRQEVGETAIKPIQGHPRLYLTSEFLPEFTKRLESDELKEVFEYVKSKAYDPINCKLDTTKEDNHNRSLLGKLLARALLYVTKTDQRKDFAHETVLHMMDYLETVRTPEVGDITRDRGEHVQTAAVVYDWCYDVMSDDEKSRFIELLQNACNTLEVGWPPFKQSDVGSHAGEQDIFRNLIAAGVAVYDEYPIIWDLAGGRLLNKFLPARLWLRQAGRQEQGFDYGDARSYSELWADMIITRMGYPSIYEGLNAKWLYPSIYARMGYGAMLPNGDMYSHSRKVRDRYDANYELTWCIAGNLYKDPILKMEYQRRRNCRNRDVFDSVFEILFTDPSVGTTTYDNLPMSSVSTYPVSGIVARTSWNEGYNSNAAMVLMNMHEVFVSDHQHTYTGDFQIYYKGLLSGTTGTYSGTTMDSEGYNKRSIAANVMLCYDPTEKFLPTWGGVKVANDGGQRNAYTDNDPDAINSPSPYVLKLSEFQIDENGKAQNEQLIVAKDVKTYSGPNKETPEFSYISGDLASAYTSKVEAYKRSMVFIDLDDSDYPAALIVFDKMTSRDKDAKKTWLLHSQEKPQISGDTTVITRTEEGFNGKLVNKTHLPLRSNLDIKAIGGENKEMFLVDGIQYGHVEGAIEHGKYRIEISTKNTSKSETYLNSMYVTDADKDLPELKMHYESRGSFKGVTVKDKSVYFSEDSRETSDKFSLSIRNNGYERVGVLVGDVKAGVWKITGGEKTFYVRAKDDEGCLVFYCAPGTYEFEYTEEAVEVSEITGEKMTKSGQGDFVVWRKTAGDNTLSNGNYLSAPYPVKLYNNTAYIPAKMLEEFGLSVKEGTNFAQITTPNGESTTLYENIEQYSLGEKTYSSAYAPVVIDGHIYIAPEYYTELVGYSFTYKGNISKILYAIKNTTGGE
ncbi:MAG: hypothetical protein IKV88_01905 [Clostridia bacterium]|nr:hypothetical protein [Clostridia bacterium]